MNRNISTAAKAGAVDVLTGDVPVGVHARDGAVDLETDDVRS